MDNYYDILNVTQSATKTDVVENYNKLKKIFSPESISVYGLFSPKMLAEKTQELELAYQLLSDASKREKYDEELKEKEITPGTEKNGVIAFKTAKKPDDEVPATKAEKGTSGKPDSASEAETKPEPSAAVILDDQPFTGKHLAKIRTEKKISVSEIYEETKIKTSMLEAIESEDFEALPARPYLRGFLVSYSSFLGLDGDHVTRDYLFIYDKWKEGR